MSWQLSVRSAETILDSSRIPPSEEIISLIKRINPTRLSLSETEREQGYLIKNRLQNLLLENYGEAFHLAPDPYSPDILIIKHNFLPSIDACHADLNALSAKALDTVGELASRPAQAPTTSEAKAKSKKAVSDCSPEATLKDAKLLLENYEYPQAEEMLASLRITDAEGLPVLVKAAGLLMDEIGAYERAIEVVLAQPGELQKEKTVRETLARSYYGSGMISEARALFDAMHPVDLGKSALYAYADICFKDGKLSQSFHLLNLSEGKEGFVTAHASLRKEIEAAMLQEARPYLQQAEAAFAQSDLPLAKSLLQQALSLYPKFPEAHQLAEKIAAQEAGAESARLWARFECSETAADRLDLLAQLLELDKENAERITALAARERKRQRQEAVEGRLQTLRVLAAQESWEPCFDILLWLSRQEEDEEGYRRACSISPFFSLLYHNKKLQRLSDGEAKEQWLRFVRLKTLRQQEQEQEQPCWNILQELKQYFHSYPLFKEEYDRVTEQEQTKAKHEVEQLFDRLAELKEQEINANNFSEAKRVVAQLRKRSGLLPAEDASFYRDYAEKALRLLDPEREEDESILDYRAYLLLGNSVKAAKFREAHVDPLLQPMFEAVHEGIADIFAISAEPIALIVAPDLVVDLATESALSGLKFLCSSHRHLLFTGSDESLVVVNVCDMTATRYRSPRFPNVAVLDMLPDRDVFFFISTKEDDNTVWRATLSGTESRITAVFETSDFFSAPEGSKLTDLCMSSTKENVYYAFIETGDRIQVVKQSLDPVISTVERTFEITGKFQGAFRLSYQPDRFVVMTDHSTTVLESNLTEPKSISRLGSSHMLRYIAVDVSRSQMYACGDGIVNVLNPNLRAVKQYLKTPSVSYLTFTTMGNVCLEKNTVLITLNGRSLFYNMQTNKFSQKFSKRGVIHTGTPSRWYRMESDMTEPVIKIKDITDEVDTMLQWQVFITDSEDGDLDEILAGQINDPDYFSIVKPGDHSENTDTVP